LALARDIAAEPLSAIIDCLSSSTRFLKLHIENTTLAAVISAIAVASRGHTFHWKCRSFKKPF